MNEKTDIQEDLIIVAYNKKELACERMRIKILAFTPIKK